MGLTPRSAAQDVVTILRLGRALKQETLSIPAMIAQATDRIAVSSIWEGIVRHDWKQGCLDQFRAEITEAENIEAFRRSYVFESLLWLRVMDSVLKSENPTWGWPKYSEVNHPARLRNEISIWFRHSADALTRVALLKLADRTVEFAIIPTLRSGAFDRRRYDAWQATVGADFKRTPSVALAHYHGRAIELPLVRSLAVASALRFARLACTLEIAYLKQSQYPAVLPSGDPDTIDIISGGIVDYETKPDGQANQLKSVGWTPTEDDYSKNDEIEWLNDWTWKFPQFVDQN